MSYTVRARIDEELKKQASGILAASGLTISDAFRMMIMRIVNEQRLPFDPIIPNKQSMKAMRDARKGNLKRSDSLSNLFEDLSSNP